VAGAESCRRRLAERQLEVERAAADVRLAHRQVRILERLRDRAWRRHQAAEGRLEMTAMNELAVMQYARRMGAPGST
jgi:flagellar biosynthesis chaperone FliJ